jgi:hypothetical protein
MSEHSERFRQQLSDLFTALAGTISSVIGEGQARGEIRADVNPDSLAALIVQSLQGAQLMLKCHRSRDCARRGMEVLLLLIEA